MLAPTRKRSVLVVEDDPDIRESIVDLLASPERTVVQAANGAEALVKLGEVHLPCLVLLDLTMPTMDGFGFLDWLRHYGQAESFPVLLMSGTSDPSTAANYPSVIGTLRKPFDVDEVRRWLDGYD